MALSNTTVLFVNHGPHNPSLCVVWFTMTFTISFTLSFTIYGFPGYIRKLPSEIEAERGGRGSPAATVPPLLTGYRP